MNFFFCSRSILLATLAAVALQLPVVASARTINVAEHSVTPGVDATLPLLRLLQSIAGEEDVVLQFDAGEYDFYPENAYEQYRAVANHDNGLKRIAFRLDGEKGWTIDGGGATFRFHGHMVPMTIDRCQSISLKNFTIDWVRSFHAELHVVANNEKEGSAVFEIDPVAYPHTVDRGQLRFQRYRRIDRIGSNIVFDPKTRSPIYATRDYWLNGNRTTATELSPGRVELKGGFPRRPPPVGSVMIVYGEHPTSRLAPAICVTDSQDLHLEEVTIREAGGMGLIVERTEDIRLDRMTVTSSPGRLVGTRADATHFVGCRGEVRVTDCLFEHMLDDAINVHGAYVKVEDRLGPRQLLCEISHFQQWGLTFAGPGDKVALLSRTTILPFGEATVESVEVLNEHRFVLTLTEDLGELPSGPLSVENLTWNADLIMRGNTIRQNRARGILVTTKGRVLIEDNYFSTQMHGILIEGDNNKWYESGAVGDVTIRNNVFENVGVEREQHYPLRVAPLLRPEQHWGDEPYHRNVRFTGNTIKSFNGLMVGAASVGDLEITDNTIELSSDFPAADEGPAITLDYCRGVKITDNKAVGFGEPLRVAATDDTEGVEQEDNLGFSSTRQLEPAGAR